LLNSSGIGVHLRGCLPYFFKSANNFLLLGNLTKLNIYESYKNVNIINCDIKPFSVNELLFFPGNILKQINKADIYFCPYINIPFGIKIPVYTTIYDIIFPDMPELLSKTGLAVRMWFFRRAYKKSKKIFTISEFSKSRIEHHLGTKKPVIITYSAIQQIYIDYNAASKNIQKKETIIFIGNIKKHKGLDCLLEAFHLAKKEGLSFQLVIVGSKDSFRSSDKHISKNIESLTSDSILFTGFISDEILMEHLSSASLLVQPSLYEGFCLPPLEAMVLGTHTLLSDIPVLKEIYDDYPVSFFKAGDAVDLKEKIIAILKNNKPKNIVLQEHLKNKYTFEKTVSVIMNNIDIF